MRYWRKAAATVAILSLTGGVALAQPEKEEPQPQPMQQDGLSHSNGNRQHGQAGNERTEARGCRVIQQKIEDQVVLDAELSSAFGDELIRDLRSMRDAALRLERYGQVAACKQVVTAIREIVENPENFRNAAQPAPGATGEGDAEGWNWQEQLARQRKGAIELSKLETPVRAEQLLGTNVRDANNDVIGEVDDVAVSANGEHSYVVIAYGGFLDMAEERSAVPMGNIQISPDRDVLFVRKTRQQLQQAPTFGRDDESWMNSNWLERTREFFSREGSE